MAKEWSNSCAAADKTCKRALEVRVSVHHADFECGAADEHVPLRLRPDARVGRSNVQTGHQQCSKFDHVDWARHWRPRWSSRIW